MSTHAETLRWVASQGELMERRLSEWCQVNTSSRNLVGLNRFADVMLPALQRLGGEFRRVELPAQRVIDSSGNLQHQTLGPALRVRKRPTAPVRVLLAIHTDTVYDADSNFQSVARDKSRRWRGPGVADAKGGLVVMLTAIEALEQHALAPKIGWEIILNPDEEIGSPGSAPLFAEAAARNQFGLVYEPALADGNLVSSRKGSWGYVLVVRGRSAHVGRDISTGRNAVHLLARFIVAAAALQNLEAGITVNVGKIEGGGPTNVVPDLAICRLNVRANDAAQGASIEKQLQALAAELAAEDGFSATLHPNSSCPPKPISDATRRLFDGVVACGKQLSLDLTWRPTGGVCDGNRLAAAGLPTLDTMGVRGGELHSNLEYIEVDSLVERASLSALLLLKLAQGEPLAGK